MYKTKAKMNKKTQMKIAVGTMWGLLGFKRGMNEYDYKYEKYDREHKKPYMYTTKIPYGFFGAFFYINPFTLPIMAFREMYRLEVNIRGLESEKKSDYYNKI